MLKEGPAMETRSHADPGSLRRATPRGILLVLADLAKNGVTSAQDNSDGTISTPNKQLKEDGKAHRAHHEGCTSPTGERFAK